jgi:Na+-transporting NADH:ubiquinone oxidoreductase subunit A
VLSGRTASAAGGFVGRYHNQVSVIPKQRQDVFVGGLTPRHAWSFHPPLWPSRQRNTMTTGLHGPLQPMIPLDTFERVLPLDILPTPLLRALLVGDVQMAEALGCLELEEEDLALCTFLCPSKIDYGVLLRSALTEIGEHA